MAASHDDDARPDTLIRYPGGGRLLRPGAGIQVWNSAIGPRLNSLVRAPFYRTGGTLACHQRISHMMHPAVIADATDAMNPR